MIYNTDDPTDLLKLILIFQSGTAPMDAIRNMPIDELEELELSCIERRADHPMRVGIFCPNEGFEGNFGDLPAELERRGCQVLWLFGSCAAFTRSTYKNKWLVINDMAKRIRGLDAIVTASVMDCLPEEPLRVLHDHLSFAHFDLEGHIDKLLRVPTTESSPFSSLPQLFNELSAFVAFLPFYDLILTPSLAVTELTQKALRFAGYDNGEPSKLETHENRLKSKTIAHLVNTACYRKEITIFQSGYCKLDHAINRYSGTFAEKLIVFAPTPNDKTGNKESLLWTSALVVNRHGAELLRYLCRKFPEYKIVFKPYKDELPDVVNDIREKLSDCINFNVDECGSQYWDLYSKTKILISDFSSTAYTFALGIGRPVIFFSPNEDSLPDEVRGNTYCRNRSEIGVVARTTDEVAESVSWVLNDYDNFLERVSGFQRRNFIKPGGASAAAAESIIHAISKQQSKDPSLADGMRFRRL